MFLQNQAAVFDLPALVRENSECYVVKDTNVRNLGVAYCRDDAQRYSFGVGKLSSDEARRTTATIKHTMDLRTGASALKEKLGLDHFRDDPGKVFIVTH